MRSDDLERLLNAALKQLPTPRAPRTLLPRVLAAVRAHVERPWYTRAWVTWPAGWQTVSLAALLALFAGAALLTPIARGMLDAAIPVAAAGPVADVAGATRGLLRTAETATTAAWILWRVVFAPFVAYALCVVALMCAACAAVGATLNHVAFGKASPR